MVIIRFRDEAMKRKALGFLATRFSGRSCASGKVMVPEAALGPLAAEGIHYSVEGRYDLASLRIWMPNHPI
jgi:hypothetical protein